MKQLNEHDASRFADRIHRRDWFSLGAKGIAATALLQLLSENAPGNTDGHRTARLHHAPRAKRVVQICLIGGLSHIDFLDYKPKLKELHGQTLTTDEYPDTFFNQIGQLRAPDWEFARRGESGLWMSDMFPHIAALADDLTVVRSMVADSANHTPALYLQNSGFQFLGFPSMGAWISYGLGNEAEELPAYVALPDARGLPNGGSTIWSSGFLPAEHQGVLFHAGGSPVRDLFPASLLDAQEELATRQMLSELNRIHLERMEADASLQARISSYELAAKMQLSVPGLTDFANESQSTLSEYGMDNPRTADFARNCLLARRLLERGVRYVQLFSGGPIAGAPRASWDAHESVKDNHTLEAWRIDRPIAALVKDLKQRGLLKDTLVMFTTEFGRTPFAQSAAGTIGAGRDHNRYGFSGWMAGAGLKPGIAYGATDDVGWKAVEHPTTWHDLHATVLHLLGIDHKQLTYYHNGIMRRLTNVHGEVMLPILA